VPVTPTTTQPPTITQPPPTGKLTTCWLLDTCSQVSSSRRLISMLVSIVTNKPDRSHHLCISTLIKRMIHGSTSFNFCCYIVRLSLDKMSSVIGWFLVTCSWSNSNVCRPGYNCAVVARTALCLFVFAMWLFKGKSRYITKHLLYGPSGN